MDNRINPNGLAADFIKSQIKRNSELEERVLELQETISKIKGESIDNDYLLYKDILNLIIPNLKFEYDKDGGYVVTINPPIHMPLNCIDKLVEEVKKYQKYSNDIHI